MPDNYDDLYELLIRFTDDNITQVIHWVIINSNRALKNPINELLVINLDILFKMVKQTKRSIFGVYKSIDEKCTEFYKKNVRTMLPDECKSYLDSSFYGTDIEQFLYEISYVKQLLQEKQEQNNSLYDINKGKYLTDNQLLINEIVEILKKEYNNRITNTKVALVKYIEPHKNSLSRLLADLEAVDNALSRLSVGAGGKLPEIADENMPVPVHE